MVQEESSSVQPLGATIKLIREPLYSSKVNGIEKTYDASV